ncbi:MAG TPA: type I restriction endonuclease subunit S [Gallionella sp.]|nr:MAG: hypothetical protein A2Z87_13360 [Gallionellales bacterium GWA2_54_124]OGT17273.1 MAG: hypothetical protein A2522_06880 [Gallionellales bacterium RIFOXYD12_FULL_53_10]HCI53069.1 type I restriction endonuclease subunit S [Gallionella sp.]
MSAIQQLLTDHIDIWTAAETEKKSGRGRASGNAGSVYGIKKLRELILELAVRGKLVPQDQEWKNLKLIDLGFWAIGSGFPTAEQGCQNDEILFVKVSDMNLAGNEKFIVVSNNTISNETAKRLRINVHSIGTVIFPKIGGAISTNKRRILTRNTAIDNNCLGLSPKAGVSTDWLYLLLSSIDLSKYQAGTSVPALAQGVLQEIPVILPCEEEQHRIVGKVDELMALCDQLESQHSNAAEAHEKLVSHLLGTLTQSQNAKYFSANWQRIAAHFDTLFTTDASIDALKQTLLQLAVMGKLVPQDANDEPASELLKRIQAEKAKLIAEGKIKKDKPLPPITDDEKPFELPDGWAWVRFNDLINPAYLISYGVLVPGADEKDGIPFVRIADLDIHNPPEKPEKSISREIDCQFERTRLEGGEILMGVVGSIGKLGIAPNSWKGANIARAICRIKVSDSLSRDYVVILLQSQFMQSSFLGDTKTLAQPTLNIGLIRLSLTPLPTMSEQHRIVTKVDELMALCDQLKSRITDASRWQQKLADVMTAGAISS